MEFPILFVGPLQMSLLLFLFLLPKEEKKYSARTTEIIDGTLSICIAYYQKCLLYAPT